MFIIEKGDPVATVQKLQLKIKVSLVGESAVGKTSLVKRFVTNEFADKYLTTLGAKVSKKHLELPLGDAIVEMDMTIWDIMGEKAVRELMKEAYFAGTRGVIATCDITRPSTLETLDQWIDSVFRVAGRVPVVIAVNKVDLKDEILRLFDDEAVRLKAAQYDAPFIHTSAKTGQGVEEAFRLLGAQIIERDVPKHIVGRS